MTSRRKLASCNRTNGRAIIQGMKKHLRAAHSSHSAERQPSTSHAVGMKPSARRPRGLKTRHAILKKAVNIASIEGLEGLTVGKLASLLGISKSGLFAHFGSKEELQSAVVEEARQIFIEKVIRPAYEFQALQRLLSLCEHWLGYAEARVF